MIVLSLFDGMSGAQLALRSAGVQYEIYYASEIDKFAISVTQHNFPRTVQLGAIEKVTGAKLGAIDLLIGGSPCQSFSTSGPCTGFSGKSALFWEYFRVLKEVRPKYFILENVSMKKEWQDVISSALGVLPICINSNLVSAQNRKRLYWTNIPGVTQPEDRNVLLRDVLVGSDVDVTKYCFSASRIAYHMRTPRTVPFFTQNSKKIGTIISTYYKTPTDGVYIEDRFKHIRKLLPVECERLQTVPDGYTATVSDTQRYKMIGNGFTIEVVAHILRFIPRV